MIKIQHKLKIITDMNINKDMNINTAISLRITNIMQFFYDITYHRIRSTAVANHKLSSQRKGVLMTSSSLQREMKQR